MADDELMRREAERLGLGATGQYPSGTTGPDDEGELTAGVAADREHNRVVVNFGKPVAWVSMTKAEARSASPRCSARRPSRCRTDGPRAAPDTGRSGAAAGRVTSVVDPADGAPAPDTRRRPTMWAALWVLGTALVFAGGYLLGKAAGHAEGWLEALKWVRVETEDLP